MIKQFLSSIDSCHSNSVDTTKYKVHCKNHSVEQRANDAIRLNGTDGTERAKLFICTVMIHT